MVFSSFAGEPVQVHDGFRLSPEARDITNRFRRKPKSRGLGGKYYTGK
jgi:hypothetical protein